MTAGHGYFARKRAFRPSRDTCAPYRFAGRRLFFLFLFIAQLFRALRNLIHSALYDGADAAQARGVRSGGPTALPQ